MEIDPAELHTAITNAKHRERQRCLSKLQEQIDIAAGAGDLALMTALTSAKAEIELGVAEPPKVSLVSTPDAGRALADEAAYRDSAVREQERVMQGLPADGFAPARERDDDLEGTTIARHLLSRRR